MLLVIQATLPMEKVGEGEIKQKFGEDSFKLAQKMFFFLLLNGVLGNGGIL